MSKMWARITHLDTLNTNYGQKKGQEWNCQFDSRSLKVKNSPDFLACTWQATYSWKALNEGYNFASNLISIRDLHTKLWAPKISRVPTLGISEFWLGSLKTKWHLGASLMARHIIYYKGEGGGFPPSSGCGEFCESMFACGSFVHQSAPTTR
jgi:hypothetical protein